MKRILALSVFVAMLSFGGTAFANGADVADCAKMNKGECTSMCAREMKHGVSECATSHCEMTDCTMC